MQAPDLPTLTLRGLGLSPTLAATLVDAAGPPRARQAGERLMVQGEPSAGLILVAGGVLKACRQLETGASQTVALFTPGDVFGGQALALGREPATVVAVTAVRISIVPPSRLKPLMSQDPAIAEALWRAMAREASILQEWLVGMGRRTALSQMAHLLCEVAVRMRRGGHVSGDTYDFPLTQVELADVTGLSPVHVNRVLQTLRAEGLIQLTRGKLLIRDWRRLVKAGDFDACYLQPPTPAPGDSSAALLLSPRDAGRARDGRDWNQL